MFKEEKKLSIVKSIDLAAYISEKLGPMSHLKLQKLLYYSQAYHLAYFDVPIIEDDFEAWVHGPVSRTIYDLLKDKSILHTEVSYKTPEGSQSSEDILASVLTQEQFELVNEIIEEFGPLTGLELENLTHQEYPWIAARNGYAPGDKCTNVIDKRLMQDFYKRQVYG